MPFNAYGEMVTDTKRVNDQEGWTDETEWQNYDTRDGLEIVNGSLQLVEVAQVDQDDIHTHYDASDKTDVSSTFPAETGPDLSADGSPSIQTDYQNGLNVVRYDRTGHFADFAANQTQPYHIFIVYELFEIPGGSEYIIGGTSEQSSFEFTTLNQGSDLGMITRTTSNNAKLTGPPRESGIWHIEALLFNGSNSVYRRDGSVEASGSLLSSEFGGISLGFLGWNNGNYSAVHIGEVICYAADKSANVEDIEAYLNARWGVY